MTIGMILIVGGSFQGKREFAKSLIGAKEEDLADGSFCGLETAFQKPVLTRLEALVARLLEREISPMEAVLGGVEHNPGIIVVCRETGCGVVPMDAGERRLREETGRLCCVLAQRAEKVYRVCCGIPALIKDERDHQG